MQLHPYLYFDGRCDAAIAFYRAALGARQVARMRFRDAPEPVPVPPEMAEKVMHAELEIGGATLLLSDGRGAGGEGFRGFSLTLTVADEAEADRAFAALAEDGEVTMPLGKTFFSPRFGMVRDRFGVGWIVLARGDAA
jgi:PhnB protein